MCQIQGRRALQRQCSPGAKVLSMLEAAIMCYPADMVRVQGAVPSHLLSRLSANMTAAGALT